MRGPDPIPIGRARLKPPIYLLVLWACWQLRRRFCSGITCFANSSIFELFYKHFYMSDLNSGLSCPETVNPTTFLKSQPLSQPFNQPFNQPLSQPLNQQLNQPLSWPINQSLIQPLNHRLSQPLNPSFTQPLSEALNQPLNQPLSRPLRQPLNQFFNQ